MASPPAKSAAATFGQGLFQLLLQFLLLLYQLGHRCTGRSMTVLFSVPASSAVVFCSPRQVSRAFSPATASMRRTLLLVEPSLVILIRLE